MKRTKRLTIKDALSILQSSIAMAIDAGLPVEIKTAVLDGVPTVGIVLAWCDFQEASGNFILVGDKGSEESHQPDEESHHPD